MIQHSTEFMNTFNMNMDVNDTQIYEGMYNIIYELTKKIILCPMSNCNKIYIKSPQIYQCTSSYLFTM